MSAAITLLIAPKGRPDLFVISSDVTSPLPLGYTYEMMFTSTFFPLI